MDFDELLNDTLDEFLLECVSKKIEEVSELPKMLKDITYLDDKQKLLDQTTKCEMLDVDDYSILNYSLSENEIHIQYDIAFVLQSFIDSEYVWRVQGAAQVEFSIPDTSKVDWSVFESRDDNNNVFWERYEKYKEYVQFQNIIYEEIECDTLDDD
ncbi:MAG: hypothetical protein K2K70_00995 [Lachnospiraceae bacterium]|nr:hypothetical protein [Lachnospiraceae bacterium]